MQHTKSNTYTRVHFNYSHKLDCTYHNTAPRLYRINGGSHARQRETGRLKMIGSLCFRWMVLLLRLAALHNTSPSHALKKISTIARPAMPPTNHPPQIRWGVVWWENAAAQY